jgi:hypothetical protein
VDCQPVFGYAAEIGKSAFMRPIPEEGRGFEPGQKVKLMIASRSKLGFKAVINNGHLGLIFNEDVFQPLRIGQQLNGYIKSVRTDGKLDLVLQPSSDDAGEQLEARILAHLERHRGGLPQHRQEPPGTDLQDLQGEQGRLQARLGAPLQEAPDPYREESGKSQR